MNDARRPLPAPMAERARAFVAGGLPVGPSRPAATVGLLRDSADVAGGGVEVYVHVRHLGMAFGGMLAFPGGKVDPADGADPAEAFVRAAIRETHEETGVVLAPGDLVPWAHWITPRFEERRYDTWFYLAALPPDQEAADVSGEASEVGWVRPADALARAEAGEWVVLPPTAVLLTSLIPFATVADVLAAGDGRLVETVVPGWLDDGTQVWSLLPDDPDYPGDDRGDNA
ncbi:NUDIX hydrolase [Jiangella mangrovi]|uniref:8-oxo-dGTP pyrophosphatase MutT (NUDIX family) n=1 Tax=Jiangella mangrovi TaxID=1524084 RepID=A0A7W9LKW0_9ACTN|nr:NUDIX hydrolase [Jiangella mangrovi]MBB5787558.1 8-oxo-dGTP pyrophosphatase MutT (NUDIX family) [Jiangella mangrovi]